MAGQTDIAANKQRERTDGLPRSPGRPKGTLNKTTALLKDAILMAAAKAGGDGEDGLVEYLTTQAKQNPQSFLPLLGKVLPLQIAGTNPDGSQAPFRIELVGVLPQ